MNEGGLAETARGAVATLEELVFTSPTEAWFRYGIDTSSGFFGATSNPTAASAARGGTTSGEACDARQRTWFRLTAGVCISLGWRP